MYALNFEYAGEQLSDYGMIICSFDSGGVETVSSGSDITFNQVSVANGNHFLLLSSIYEQTLQCTFQICKNPCLADSQNEMMFTVAEISSIQRWLCRKNQYYRFKLNQDGYEDIYWNGTFSVKEIQICGQVYGLELTLYTDAPFGYQDEISISEDASLPYYSFNIYDTSDEEGYIYPKMEIEITNPNGCDFWMKNDMDSYRITSINNCKYGEKITLDGKNHLITSSISHANLASDFNYNFPRILNTYNDINNKFTLGHDALCKIIITYSPIRKIGI